MNKDAHAPQARDILKEIVKRRLPCLYNETPGLTMSYRFEYACVTAERWRLVLSQSWPRSNHFSSRPPWTWASAVERQHHNIPFSRLCWMCYLLEPRLSLGTRLTTVPCTTMPDNVHRSSHTRTQKKSSYSIATTMSWTDLSRLPTSIATANG